MNCGPPVARFGACCVRVWTRNCLGSTFRRARSNAAVEVVFLQVVLDRAAGDLVAAFVAHVLHDGIRGARGLVDHVERIVEGVGEGIEAVAARGVPKPFGTVLSPHRSEVKSPQFPKPSDPRFQMRFLCVRNFIPNENRKLTQYTASNFRHNIHQLHSLFNPT